MIFSFAANLNSTCTLWLSSSTLSIVNCKCFNSPTVGSVSVFHLMVRSSKLYGVIALPPSRGSNGIDLISASGHPTPGRLERSSAQPLPFLRFGYARWPLKLFADNNRAVVHFDNFQELGENSSKFGILSRPSIRRKIRKCYCGVDQTGPRTGVANARLHRSSTCFLH